MSDSNHSPDSSDTSKTKGDKKKAPKRTGPFRLEAILPLAIIIGAVVFYFTVLFDLHLRKSIEWIGYRVMGAEVNVGFLKTSFLGGTFHMSGLQLTDPLKPSQNSLEIGDIRFAVSWDALLRGKLAIEEVAVEGIQVSSPRKKPGKVKPPEPPAPKDSKTAKVLQEEAEKLADRALTRLEDTDTGSQVFTDLIGFLGNKQGPADLGANWESQIVSKKKIKELELQLQQNQEKWKNLFAGLPQQDEFNVLQGKISAVKTSGFSQPQELQAELQKVQAILSEVDAQVKKVQGVQNELGTDLKGIDQSFKLIENQIKLDIADLESKFKLPKLDVASFSKGLFFQYLKPYLSKFQQAKALADKYLPPNLKKSKDQKTAVQIKPHPRAKGIVYEFGKVNAYPMFWVKKVSISSKATPDGFSANLSGVITNIVSNQAIIGKPTTGKVEGDIPSLQWQGFKSDFEINQLSEEGKYIATFMIGQYPLSSTELVSSPDVKIGFQQARGGLRSQFELTGFDRIKYSVNNQFDEVQYKIDSTNALAKEMLSNIFSGITKVTADVYGEGSFPNFPVNITSNLGGELQKGFSRELQKKIDEFRKQIQVQVNAAIEAEKKKLESQYLALRAQAEGEVKKATDQINTQKSSAEAQANKARKDFEDKANQEKQRLEAEAKKALGAEGEKKIEDLKKKFGF